MTVKKAKEQKIELKYNGWLDGAKTVYLHYGIGESWDNITDCKMRKLKNYYKTEITVPQDQVVKFCFKDDNGNWDNNYGCDYTYMHKEPTEYTCVDIAPYVPKKVNK